MCKVGVNFFESLMRMFRHDFISKRYNKNNYCYKIMKRKERSQFYKISVLIQNSCLRKDCRQHRPPGSADQSRRHRAWLVYWGCISWWASPWPSTWNTADGHSDDSGVSWWSDRTCSARKEGFYYHYCHQNMRTHQTFLAAVSLSPARLLGQNIQEAEQ